MNILHISTSDLSGGAAKACYNISFALNSIGINSKILVQQKRSGDSSVTSINSGYFYKLRTKIRVIVDYLLIRFFSVKAKGRFTIPFIGTMIHNHPLVKKADIINLHWVNGGFLSLKSLEKLMELRKPIVWTFHDMWVFTGGCHYSLGCTKFITECRDCPSLIFRGQNDFSKITFYKKKKIFDRNQFIILACSNWLAGESKKSDLLKNCKISTLPNPIDTELFKPQAVDEARDALNLPKNKFIFLFSAYTASEERKGLPYLREALLSLSRTKPELSDNIEIIVMGSSTSRELNDLPFHIFYTGRLENADKIVQFYNSADLFVAPSVQENLSNTVMESLACGTPVLAFNIGGMPDMIDHMENGYLADEVSSEQLMKGFLWFLGLDADTRTSLNNKSRTKVLSNFTLSIIAKKYADQYQRLLDSNQTF